MLNNNIKIGFLFLVFCLLIFLTINRHSKSGIQNYHSEIWADKAGYYIYLPSFFIYDFEAEKLPADIDINTGCGFFIEDGKIRSKYTSGVALMQVPFFLSAHFLSTFLGFENDGFSLIYHKSINIAAVCYTTLSFVFLFLFLSRYVNKSIAFYTILCLYLGTNVFYYSIFETGMSHIYSFFLFSVFLYLSPLIFLPKQKIIIPIIFGIIIGLIVAVRPINLIFFPVYFIFNQLKLSDLTQHYKRVLLIAAFSFIVLVPQLLYWKYAFGDFLVYSYGNEGFPYKFSPKIFTLWFSTNNGLFTFNPIAILAILGIFYTSETHNTKALFIGLYFLFITYVFASWHDLTYGCSLGARPYVEYYTVLSLPFAYFLSKIKTSGYKVLMIFLLVIFIIYNLKMVFSYDGCWYGGNWDFAEVLRILSGPPK